MRFIYCHNAIHILSHFVASDTMQFIYCHNAILILSHFVASDTMPFIYYCHKFWARHWISHSTSTCLLGLHSEPAREQGLSRTLTYTENQNIMTLKVEFRIFLFLVSISDVGRVSIHSIFIFFSAILQNMISL